MTIINLVNCKFFSVIEFSVRFSTLSFTNWFSYICPYMLRITPMNAQNTQTEWDLIIKAKSPVLDFKFNDLWNYRDLLLVLVKRDFVSFYKQTVLGPLWFFIQPLFTTLVFAFVFGNLAGEGLAERAATKLIEMGYPVFILFDRNHCLELFCGLFNQNKFSI